MAAKTMNERDTMLAQWLGEAYAKEAELEADLTAHIALTEKMSYKKRLRQHLTETRITSVGSPRGSRSSAVRLRRRRAFRSSPPPSAKPPARRSPPSRVRSVPRERSSPSRQRPTCATPRRSSARSTLRSRSTCGSRRSRPRSATRTPRSLPRASVATRNGWRSSLRRSSCVLSRRLSAARSRRINALRPDAAAPVAAAHVRQRRATERAPALAAGRPPAAARVRRRAARRSSALCAELALKQRDRPLEVV